MLIDIRAPERLRGPEAIDLAPVLEAVTQAVRESNVDTTHLRVLIEWIQYRESFREPVSARVIGANGAQPRGGEQALELGIDLRRLGSVTPSSVAAALEAEVPAGRRYIEPWRMGSDSCLWDFNGLYWKFLALWEEATGRTYEQALPGGETAARDRAGARDLITSLFDVWDDLAKRRALPDALYVVELGVGNGSQARVWLDEFVEHDRRMGRDYYHRLHYLLGDYSAHILDRARTAVAHHGERVSSLVVDARRPTDSLAFLRTKAFLVYISNVYDNLPTDEIVRLGGQTYRVEVRAYLPEQATEEIAESFGAGTPEVPELVNRLLRLGPELLADSRPQLFTTPLAATEFWRKVWSALRLEERYVPLDELDMYAVAPGVSGELLRPILESNGDVRMHVSNGAASSFVDTLPLLHPMGSIVCHDIFVTDIHQYLTTFRGPGKYDGSVVNWVNGQVLSLVGRRRGYEVSFAPFLHRAGSNVLTLRTRVME